MNTIVAYLDAYPLVDLEVGCNAGQMVLYQKYEILVSRRSADVKRAME